MTSLSLISHPFHEGTEHVRGSLFFYNSAIRKAKHKVAERKKHQRTDENTADIFQLLLHRLLLLLRDL